MPCREDEELVDDGAAARLPVLGVIPGEKGLLETLIQQSQKIKARLKNKAIFQHCNKKPVLCEAL